MAEWTEKFQKHLKQVLADAQDKKMCAMINTSVDDAGQTSYVIVMSPNPLDEASKAKIAELAKSVENIESGNVRQGALCLVDNKLMVVGLDKEERYFQIPIAGAVIDGETHKCGLMVGQIYDIYYALVSRHLNHYTTPPYELYPQLMERGEEKKIDFMVETKGAILLFKNTIGMLSTFTDMKQTMVRASDLKSMVGVAKLQRVEGIWCIVTGKTGATSSEPIAMPDDKDFLMEGDTVMFMKIEGQMPYLCTKTSPFTKL